MKNESAIYSKYFTYVKPISKLPVVKNYAPIIFSLFTVMILTIFAIKPTIETILVLQKKLADSEQVLQKITEKANNLSLARDNYDNLDPNAKEQIYSTIPDIVNLKSLIQSLESLANANDASVSALQIQPVVIETKKDIKQVGTVAEISFTFNTEGEYKNLITLLDNIKSNNRLISIENLSISKTSTGTTLVMSISGKAYYLK